MISPDSRSLERIEKAAAENHATNPILVEKVIRAFSLLESLAAARILASFSFRLNQLKSQNPEAFFYGLKTAELMK